MPDNQPNPAIPAQRLRILFYLPVVTPWWFENIVIHLIRVLSGRHEVHVMVPPLWNNTGLGPDQVPLIADLAHVSWHVLDGPDHPNLRTAAAGEDDLFTLLEAIAADITLCRSADIISPARFPGIVRYIMEGAAPPIPTPPQYCWLAPTLFDAGILPQLSKAQSRALDTFARPLWEEMHCKASTVTSRIDFLRDAGLPTDKSIVGLALEYEHEENFFLLHHPFPSNAAMIASITAQLDETHVLAITNHPLNDLYGDNSAIVAAIADSGGKAVLLQNTANAGEATLSLARHCGGMIVANSKSWFACAAMGTPILRLSEFASGEWLGTYADMAEFLNDIETGNPRRPDPRMAQLWFAFHLANNVFDPADPALTPNAIIERVLCPIAPDRWADAILRHFPQPQKEALNHV